MRKNVIHGLTHDLDGRPLVRTPRVVKVGIGKLSGKDAHVWIDRTDGKWRVQVGSGSNAVVKSANDRREAEALFREAWKRAPDRNYPVKLPYFTFSRTGMDGKSLVPDFDAIEKHGPQPTELGILFTDDEPFDCAYQMWSQTGLVCFGDGIDASRDIRIAREPWEKELSLPAAERGERWFTIESGCSLNGCPYSLPGKDIRGRDAAAACKTHARLSFQLAAFPRLGGKAAIDTTSRNSISAIHSALEEYKRITNGLIAGIPLVLTLRAKKVIHDGQASTAWILGLEFRPEDIRRLRQKMLDAGAEYRAQMAPASRQLAAPEAPEAAIDATGGEIDPSDMESELPAAAIMAEFYHDSPDNSEDGDPDPDDADTPPEEPTQPVPPTAAEQMQQATEEKQSTLAGKLRNRRGRNNSSAPATQPAQEAAKGETSAAPSHEPPEADAPKPPETAPSGDTEGAAGAGTGLFGDTEKTWFDD